MDNNQVQSAFRHKVKQVKYAFLISVIGVALIMFGTVKAYISGNIIIQSMGVVLFIGGIVVNIIAWRCPVCNKPLPNRQSVKNINYCSNCNAKLK